MTRGSENNGVNWKSTTIASHEHISVKGWAANLTGTQT